MRSIQLRIGRIVVEGLPPYANEQFLRALQHRLRAWAQDGMANEFPGETRYSVQSIAVDQLHPGASPDHAAKQIVRSIQHNVSQSRGAPGASTHV